MAYGDKQGCSWNGDSRTTPLYKISITSSDSNIFSNFLGRVLRTSAYQVGIWDPGLGHESSLIEICPSRPLDGYYMFWK